MCASMLLLPHSFAQSSVGATLRCYCLYYGAILFLKILLKKVKKKKRKKLLIRITCCYFLNRFLATGNSYVSMQLKLCIGKSNLFSCADNTQGNLVEQKLVMPASTEGGWREDADTVIFWQRCDFPNCLQAIDGKHIRIVEALPTTRTKNI